ncbi:MAG: hypothetical protein ACREP7_16620 [Lysobacter sp.]
MNIYKNLMFLHGHFVDPRDADEDCDAIVPPRPAVQAPARPAPEAATSRVQVSRVRSVGWRIWLRLWPSESAKIPDHCDVRGCA